MNIATFVSKHAKRGATIVGGKVATGFNRADELGGDLRDYLLERDDSPKLRVLGERLAKLGGVMLEEVGGPSEYEQQVATAAAAAPPPTAAAVANAERTGPGDSEIAAQIYGKESCPWTGRTRTLLNESKVDFDFIELDDAEHAHWEGKLAAETSQTSVPCIFLRGEFVGGFNELSEIVRLGHLEYRTSSLSDQAVADASRPHAIIDIAPRRESAA
ncbi:MAG: glutaredoxin [Myxococcales bacterium]|nr:glutaredoxin [Myxococcales bacterium]